MGSSAGGAFLPSDPPPSTGAVLVSPVISGATFTGTATGTISGVTFTGSTLSTPTINSPVISGATLQGAFTAISGVAFSSTGVYTLTAPTLAGAIPITSGAAFSSTGTYSFATPNILATAAGITATGTTGTNGAAASAVTPALYFVTGASGAGIALPTGAGVAGSLYVFLNPTTTGVINYYAVGGTINGTTGTTAFAVTSTGNRFAVALCSAAGVWAMGGNT